MPTPSRFVHSMLTFDVGHVRGVAEPPESMTTIDLLHLAEVALEDDDLESAARYVNQLQGEARRGRSGLAERCSTLFGDHPGC